MSLIELYKALNGKTFTIVAFIFCLFLLFYFYGCEPKVCSLLNPDSRITRNELSAEISVFNARVQERIRSLDNQDSIKRILLDQASLVTSGGTFNPIGLVNSLISVFAVGYAVDSRKKVKLANQKALRAVNQSDAGNPT